MATIQATVVVRVGDKHREVCSLGPSDRPSANTLRDHLEKFELCKIVFGPNDQMTLGKDMSDNDFAWVVTEALKPINQDWVETWNKSDLGVVTGKQPNLCLRLYARDEAEVTPTQPGSKSQPTGPSSQPISPHGGAQAALLGRGRVSQGAGSSGTMGQAQPALRLPSSTPLHHLRRGSGTQVALAPSPPPATTKAGPDVYAFLEDHAEDDFDGEDAAEDEDEDEDEDDLAGNLSDELDDPISTDEAEEERQRGKALAKQMAQQRTAKAGTMRVDDPISESEEEEQQQGKAPAKQKARQRAAKGVSKRLTTPSAAPGTSKGGTPKTPSRRLDPAQHHTPTRVGGAGCAAPVPAPQPGSAGRQGASRQRCPGPAVASKSKPKKQKLNQQPRVKFGLGPQSLAFVTASATKHVKLLAVRGVDPEYPIPYVGHGELALPPLPGEVEDWWWPVVFEAIQGYMIQDWVAKYGRKLPPAWTFATGEKKVKEAVQQQRTKWSRFKKDAGLAGKTQLVSKGVEKETAKWWSEWGRLRKLKGAQWRPKQWEDNLAVVHHLREHGVLPELLPASWVVGSVPVDMEGDPVPLATPALDTWTPFLRDDLQRVAGDVASIAGIQVDTAWQVVHEEMDSLMPEFKALLQRLGDGALVRATSHPQRQQQQEQGQQQLGQQQQQTHPELNIQASLARYNDDVSPTL